MDGAPRCRLWSWLGGWRSTSSAGFISGWSPCSPTAGLRDMALPGWGTPGQQTDAQTELVVVGHQPAGAPAPPLPV